MIIVLNEEQKKEALEIAEQALLESMMEEGHSRADAIRDKLRAAFAPSPPAAAPEAGTSAGPATITEPVAWVAWDTEGCAYMFMGAPERQGPTWITHVGHKERLFMLDKKGTWTDNPRPLFFAPPAPSGDTLSAEYALELEQDNERLEQELAGLRECARTSVALWKAIPDNLYSPFFTGSEFTAWREAVLALPSGTPPVSYTQAELDAAVAKARREGRIEGARQVHMQEPPWAEMRELVHQLSKTAAREWPQIKPSFEAVVSALEEEGDRLRAQPAVPERVMEVVEAARALRPSFQFRNCTYGALMERVLDAVDALTPSDLAALDAPAPELCPNCMGQTHWTDRAIAVMLDHFTSNPGHDCLFCEMVTEQLKIGLLDAPAPAAFPQVRDAALLNPQDGPGYDPAVPAPTDEGSRR
jgi:hypothetical protein